MPSSLAGSASPASIQTAPRVVVRLLGSFGLVIDGEDRSGRLTYEKVRLTLAVLALAQSQPVSRAKLARMIWPDMDVPEGRARLRHALHTLKQVFSDLPAALEVTAAHIRLRTDLVQVDVLSLVGDPSTPFQIDDEQRLDWYRPPLLDTPNAPPTEEYESWLQGWRARIEIEMAQWRQRTIDRHLQDNALSTALAHATRWTERWPEDESCHRMLIRLLVATGQQDAAMLAFEHCSRILADRLGMAPSAETRALLGIEQSAPAAAPARARTYGREYRPLAVLAVTLSWTSALRDAESAIESLARARSDALAVIQNSGAWVVHSDGSALLAYFGYPGITEHPITGAVELAKALSDLSLDEGVTLGMGLHADVALCESETQCPDAGALLSQTALPLSWQARHRETLLSQQSVQRLQPAQFLTLKRAGRVDHVLEHHPQAEVAPRLHGRGREFDFLVGLWTRQLPSRPPTVLTVTGFPGVGKSLLATAIAEYAAQSGGQRILLACEEARLHVPLYPATQWLRRQYAGMAARLHDVDSDEILGRFCDTLGLKRTESAGLSGLLSPTPMTESLLGEAQELLYGILARYSVDVQQPRLIVIENLQWADPATLALINKIKAKPSRMPLMVIATSRAKVVDESERTLRLGPLSDASMAQFVSHRSRTQKLSRKQRQHVIQHCHGVPLYALLLMRQTTQDLPLEYSCGLTDTLCVEMQRLPPAALEVAQLSALLDATTDRCMLGAILAMSPEVVQSAVSHLLEDGMLVELADGVLSSPILVQLAIKRMTPRKTRQRLHTLITRYLINIDAPPATIAPHAEAADEPSTPTWWRRAAVQEARAHQTRRARADLERALKHLHRIDTSEARRQFEFECQMLLGELAAVTAGPGAEQTLMAFDAANRLLPADDPKVALHALWAKWQGTQHTARYTEALDLARRHMRIARDLDNEEAKGWSHYAMGQTYLWCGQLPEAEHELARSVEVLSAAQSNLAISSAYGEQAIALAYATQALCIALRGRIEHALALSQTALGMAVQGNVPVTIVSCVLMNARVQYLANDVRSGAMLCAGLMAQIPSADALSPWYAVTRSYAELPEAFEAGCPQALQKLQDMLPVVQAGMPTLLNSSLCLVARALIAQQAFDEAADALARAEEINRDQGSYTVEPEIHCLRGDLWQAAGQPQKAHAAWAQARASAIRHGLLVYVGWVESRMAALPQQ